MGVVVHHPEALLDEMAFQRRILAEIRDELLQHVRIEDRALHVLGAGIFAALDLQHFEAAFGHGEGGGVAGHAGADHDRIEFFFDHRALSSSSAIRSRECGDNRLRKASVSAGNSRIASVTMPRWAKSKIGAFLSVLIATIRSAPSTPTRCWIAPEMPAAI